jgi:hypothetical protein
MPLRRSAEVTIPVGSGVGPKGLGIYRSGARAWEWEGANWNAQAGSMSAESGDLGEFAVMRDFAAPQVKLLTPARSAPRLPYSSWQLVATVAEVGSGIDASESAFVVDGVHQPTEWDPEMRQLRWRPLAPPGDGAHTYELRAVDRAGNVKTIRGIFVLDSSRR